MTRHRGGRSLCALLCLLALSTLLRPALALVLEARDNKTLPAPVSIAPDQDWKGIDGSWNTISLRVGSDEQWVHAFVSTASQQTWVVNEFACRINQTDAETNVTTEVTNMTCVESRGRTFNTSSSTTWDDNGFFQLWTEKNLGLVGNGQYGWDTVAMGLPGEEGPTLKNTTIGTLISPYFWLGHFGINPKPTNFSAFTDPSPSYMTYLFDQKQIPSISFGYTAGAQYHQAVVLSSLTLGGYDSSRFIPNDLSFGFAPDNERDIVVGVVGLTANSSTKPNIDLLENQESFTMYIDSTIAELWLPVAICQQFEEAFGLKYDNNTELYLVDDLLHQTLKAENPSITFSLGQKYITNATVDITLPYSAFDLQASVPYRGLKTASRYFPIRRGSKDSQYVLGRTFLQEAYLIVDWERQNFSVSAVSWVYDHPEHIVPIISPKYTVEVQGASKSRHFTTGSIIGVALGAGFGFAIMVSAAIWWFWRKRQKQKLEKVKAEYEAKAAAAVKEPPAEKSEEPSTFPAKDLEEGTNVFPKAELPADSFCTPEMSTDRKEGGASSPTLPSPLVEAENTERQIFEMPGDIPARAEAGGRQLSEKESMVVRERIYNGVDPNGAPDISPGSEEPPRRLVPISPSEVAMVNRRLPTCTGSPTTPRAPRDGATLEANDTFFQPPAPRAPRDGRFLEAEDTLLCPISPVEGSEDTSRRRFSYEMS